MTFVCCKDDEDRRAFLDRPFLGESEEIFLRCEGRGTCLHYEYNHRIMFNQRSNRISCVHRQPWFLPYFRWLKR